MRDTLRRAGHFGPQDPVLLSEIRVRSAGVGVDVVGLMLLTSLMWS